LVQVYSAAAASLRLAGSRAPAGGVPCDIEWRVFHYFHFSPDGVADIALALLFLEQAILNNNEAFVHSNLSYDIVKEE